MFTGLCEEVGEISLIKRTEDGYVLSVTCSCVLDGVTKGDSIAIDGACHTITSFGQNAFEVDSTPETIEHTNLRYKKVGSKVNLERSVSMQSRLGGHFVTGHIDCTARVTRLEKQGVSTLVYFSLSEEYSNKLVEKGSVTVNGVSLTVCKPIKDEFYVSIIPHTLSNTSISTLKVGDIVNIETDILGKYVENFLKTGDRRSKIDIGLLERTGFLDE